MVECFKIEFCTLASKPGEAKASGSMTLREYNARNLALALDGSITNNTGASQTLTARAVTLAGVGEFVDIGADLLSDVVVEDASGNELVAGTDYTLNGPFGRIAAAREELANAEITVSANAAADNAIRITIGALPPGYYAIRCTALNTINNVMKKIYLRKVRIATSENVNFVSDDGTDYETLKFNLTPEIPTGMEDYGWADNFAMR